MPQMHLRTLGALALEGSAFNRHKPLLLLAYLALEGPTSRRELADLFFLSSKDARDSLSTTLRRLRQESPTLVEFEGECVHTGVPCDASHLMTLLEAGQRQEGIASYGGPFLKGIDLELSSELEEWVYGTRELLAGRVRDAHLQLAGAYAHRGLFDEAARLAERAYCLAGAPEPEPEVLRQIHCLLLAGGNPRATQVEGEADALGVSLVHTPKEAREQLGGTPVLVTPAVQHTPNNLPFSAMSFIGRDPELAELGTLIQRPDARLITLLGPGGVGKSRLAIEAARAQLKQEAFPDGVFVVQLDAIINPGTIPVSMAEALPMSLQGAEAPLVQVTRFIGTKHMLLVLDNYEQLVEAAPLASDLLKACPNLHLLVTSRERLSIYEEHLFLVEGLAYPQSGVTLEDARHYDAVKLFLLRAQRQDRAFNLSATNLADIQVICRLVDGMPLALELSATWVRHLSPQEITQEIERNVDFLKTEYRDLPERQRSVRVTFEYSWQLLPERERQALRRLSVFRGGFRREAASAVAGINLPMLASLIDKSLLRTNDQARYDFHPLVQGYAQEKLQDHADEERRTREHHARYFFQFLKEQHQAFLSNAQSKSLRVLEQELENVRVAWAWAVQERWVTELRLASPLLRHAFDKTAQCQEGIQLFEQALAALYAGNEMYQVARGRILIDQAHFYHYLGAHREAMQRAQQGLTLLERYGEDANFRDGLNILGASIWRQGDYLKAKQIGERSLAISRALQDERGISNVLSYLAAAEQTLGNFRNAERYCQESLDICRRSGHKIQAVIVLKNYGTLLRTIGDSRRAKPLLEEALELAQETNYPRVTSDILSNLALSCLDLGESSKAQGFAEQAVALAAKSGIRPFEMMALVALGRSETALGNHQSAQAHFAHGLSTAQALNNGPFTLMLLTALGESFAVQGNLEQAKQLLEFVCQQPSLEAYYRTLAERILNGLRERSGAKRSSDKLPNDMNGLINDILARVTSSRS